MVFGTALGPPRDEPTINSPWGGGGGRGKPTLWAQAAELIWGAKDLGSRFYVR